MLIAERRRRLLERVRERGYASFRELADTLGISESTVRRDLRQMVADGLLESIRGGVGPLPGGDRFAGSVLRPGADGSAFGSVLGPADGAGPAAAADTWASLVEGITRSETDRFADDPVHRERQAIAAHAATLVKPGSAILLGPGRTHTPSWGAGIRRRSWRCR